MRRTVRGAIVTLTAALAFPLGFAAQAQAQSQTAAAGCGADFICMWEDANYTGSKYVDLYAVSPVNVGALVDIDGWDGDNEISSVSNRTRFHILMYDNDNGTGFLGCITPGQSIPSLWRNDEMESFRFATSC